MFAKRFASLVALVIGLRQVQLILPMGEPHPLKSQDGQSLDKHWLYMFAECGVKPSSQSSLLVTLTGLNVTGTHRPQLVMAAVGPHWNRDAHRTSYSFPSV